MLHRITVGDLPGPKGLGRIVLLLWRTSGWSRIGAKDDWPHAPSMFLEDEGASSEHPFFLIRCIVLKYEMGSEGQPIKACRVMAVVHAVGQTHLPVIGSGCTTPLVLLSTVIV